MTTEIDAEGLRKKIESDPDEGEIGVGFEMFTPEAEAALERMAFAALPRWARDELTALRARTSEAEPVAHPVLGYANLYRDKDGELELGATDLEPGLVSSFPNASEYMDFVGRVEVRLASSATHPTPASDDQVEAAAKALYEEDDPWNAAFPWPNPSDGPERAEAYRRLARAALAAMGEYQAMSENAKLISVRFTADELYELDCLLANGVCDYSDPSNKVAASAYEKISRASRKRVIATLRSPKP